jgi:hypothetical protein
MKQTHVVELTWTSDQIVEEAATYITQNKHKRQITMLLSKFEPAIPGKKPLQNYNLESSACEAK